MSESAPGTPWIHSDRTRVAAAVGIVLLVLFMFGDVLFSAGDRTLSVIGLDISSHFMPSREFGFSEMRRGNLALWNPHQFSGSPYLGSFQSALLYPPNLVYLALPLAKALTADMAFHVLLLGCTMFLWCRSRGLCPPAAFFSAAIAMFSGAFFLHIIPGHPTYLAVMAWVPLVFQSIDSLLERPSPGWCLIGIAAVTMQALGGYPPALYITGLAAAIYCVARFVARPASIRAVPALAAMAVAPLALAAVQLLTGLAVSGESVRGGGVSAEFAGSFSLHPSALVTLLVPTFFGDIHEAPFWGRWLFWEMTPFIGITALLLAAYAGVRAGRESRRHLWMMALTMLVIAMGQYTPVFGVLHEWLPGFDRFRSPSKYVFITGIFLALLSGIGAHRLLTEPPLTGRIWVFPAAMALLLGIACTALGSAGRGGPAAAVWGDLVRSVQRKDHLVFDPLPESSFAAAANHAFVGVAVAACVCVALSLLLWLARRAKWSVYVLLALGIAEVFAFARVFRPTFDIGDTARPMVDSFAAANSGEYRVADSQIGNYAQYIGEDALWGYEVVILARYARLMGALQGWPPGEVRDTLTAIHPAYAMLRGRYVWNPDAIQEMNVEPLPRFLFPRGYRVESDPDVILGLIGDPTRFDPRETVILEAKPRPIPQPGGGGTVEVLDESTDHATLHVSLERAAVLLVTDAYAEGWRVVSLPGSSQSRYDLVPANYALRAIPLGAGEHRFRMEYSPIAYRIGRWISLGALAAYLAGVAFWLTRRIADRPVSAQP